MRNTTTEPARQNPAIVAQLSGDDTASAGGKTVTSSSPILSLCRALLEGGIDPATPLYAYRGDVLCLLVRAIGEAAALGMNGRGSGFKRRVPVGMRPSVSSRRRAGIGRRSPCGGAVATRPHRMRRAS